MWATDHSRWSVTIATIPPAAVDRIEVLNDGGSAPNVVPNAGSYFDAAGNQFTLIPGTRGIATASDFIVNGGSNSDFNLRFQQLVPRETRYGGLVEVKFDLNDYLKLYDYLLLYRNEELSSYQNQGIYANLTI